VGVAIGAGLGAAAAPWMSTLLFNESPRDPAVYAFVTMIILVVAVAATALPAIAAAKLDPNSTLRAE